MSHVAKFTPAVAYHPGETLHDKLEELQMSIKEFALRVGKPEKTIIAVTKGDSNITPEMAVLFENALQIPARFWLNTQRTYDEYKARESQKTVLAAAIAWTKSFPISEMIKKAWLPDVKTIEEKTQALLSFFGFAKHDAWYDYYEKSELKVAFRISLAHTKEAHAISAWLRKGELQAQQLETVAYNGKKFKAALQDIKQIMAAHPNDFFQKLQAICLNCGVKLVTTPCLPKAPIDGATRWLNDTPLIQLSGRYKRNDNFWFTFYHEAAHILLHGKKDIFLELKDDINYDKEKEAEADNFAIKWTFSEEEEHDFVKEYNFSDKRITAFAQSINTHPALIVGRLQRKKHIEYHQNRELCVPIDLEEYV